MIVTLNIFGDDKELFLDNIHYQDACALYDILWVTMKKDVPELREYLENINFDN